MFALKLFRHALDERQAIVDGGTRGDNRYFGGLSGVLINPGLSAYRTLIILRVFVDGALIRCRPFGRCQGWLLDTLTGSDSCPVTHGRNGYAEVDAYLSKTDVGNLLPLRHLADGLRPNFLVELFAFEILSFRWHASPSMSIGKPGVKAVFGAHPQTVQGRLKQLSIFPTFKRCGVHDNACVSK